MIIRPDDLLVQGPGRYNTPDVSEAWAESMRTLRAALADDEVDTVGILIGIPGSGKTTWANKHDRPGLVLFDAVWANARRRASMAARIRAAGKDALAVWVKTPLSIALLRNAQRPPWRQVPEPVCRDAAIRLRRARPHKREGWSQLVVVNGLA